MSVWDTIELGVGIGALAMGIRGFFDDRTWEASDAMLEKIVRDDDSFAWGCVKAFGLGYLVTGPLCVIHGIDNTVEDISNLVKQHITIEVK